VQSSSHVGFKRDRRDIITTATIGATNTVSCISANTAGMYLANLHLGQEEDEHAQRQTSATSNKRGCKNTYVASMPYLLKNAYQETH
jgi:hypothetical protein